MAMTMRRLSFVLAVLLVASRADAQFSADNRMPAEQYHAELSLRFWTPTPQLRLSTGSLTSLGVGAVDFVQEFGLANDRFTEYEVTSKPGRKHKLHYSSIPIKYEASTTISRTLQFGGVTIPVTAPASATFDWRLKRYGYEYDFVAASHGYVGVLTDIKDNKLNASIAAGPYGSDALDLRVWVPTVGMAGRVYPHRMFSVSGDFNVEVTRFKGFDKLKTDWDGKFVDFDVYGTVNFGKNFAVHGGYRSIVVDYTSSDDLANIKLKGMYWGGNVRF
jgi:hypothetical protein